MPGLLHFWLHGSAAGNRESMWIPLPERRTRMARVRFVAASDGL